MFYIIDPTEKFQGAVLTSMRDGVHSDYGGETIEELRLRHNNPNLRVATDAEVMKMASDYQHELHNAPFEEVDEDCYYDSLDCLPPKRYMTDMFFVGECYYGEVYPFLFKRDGRFFRGRKMLSTTKAQLETEISEFMANLKKEEALCC